MEAEQKEMPTLNQGPNLRESKEALEQSTKLATITTTGVALVAIFFDVGYFSGLDINLFTLFSLTEHMLFSLEALPYAVIFFTIILFSTYISIISLKPAQKLVDSISDGRIKKILSRTVSLILAFTFITTIVYVMVMPHWIIVAFVPFAMWYFLYGSKMSGVHRTIAYGAVQYIFLLLAAFSVGAGIAKSYASASNGSKYYHEIAMKDKTIINGRVIRSGNSGVLYFDTITNQIIFSKWDSIESIASVRSSPTK